MKMYVDIEEKLGWMKRSDGYIQIAVLLHPPPSSPFFHPSFLSLVLVLSCSF